MLYIEFLYCLLEFEGFWEVGEDRRGWALEGEVGSGGEAVETPFVVVKYYNKVFKY